MYLKEPLLLRSNAHIDGRWEAADSGATIVVNDPATGQPIGEVPQMGAAETKRAIAAAVPEEFVTALVSKVLGEMPIL